MKWTDVLLNKIPIESIYTKIPSLVDVRLHEMQFHQDGPRVSLRFDPAEYPDNPPRKWIVQKFDQAQITLVLTDVSQLNVLGWGVNNIGDIMMSRSDEGVCVKFVGTSMQMNCCARFVNVERITGYCHVRES
ncbi:conserved hypothetical protein [Planctopirus limnophila DSM 3776]|uniref:Immunity protein 50 n=1 Tax=Planctopirus limnophila (strain ATCC 43296 / DSM 3776 / IFAM 1008 / Mu 290) TaxID=521674 RepID=D5SVS0_PLAL2|nr:conserved hypothetical protein [Planctopirus limnophila DSM 3776]